MGDGHWLTRKFLVRNEDLEKKIAELNDEMQRKRWTFANISTKPCEGAEGYTWIIVG